MLPHFNIVRTNDLTYEHIAANLIYELIDRGIIIIDVGIRRCFIRKYIESCWLNHTSILYDFMRCFSESTASMFICIQLCVYSHVA